MRQDSTYVEGTIFKTGIKWYKQSFHLNVLL